MKRNILLLILFVLCLFSFGCKSYEHEKVKMVSSVLEYQTERIREDDTDYRNLADLRHILFLSHKNEDIQESLLKHVSQKEEESRKDWMLSLDISLSEIDILMGKPQASLNKIHPLDYYKQDLMSMRSLLIDENLSLYSDFYPRILSDLFSAALNKMNSSSEESLWGVWLLFSGNSSFVSDRYERIHDAYLELLEYLITAPEEHIENYCSVVLKTIKKFSDKLKIDEFYMIYMDMVNSTAASYLGTDIVEILNTYTYYSFVTDKDVMFDRYLAISIE